MYGGIDQLVDTYKGNPQPLAQKVQRDQQSQPPGRIPPDLEEALALQKITELRNSAQSQQAMQAGGAQPSVVEKLRQMLGGMQQQAQMGQAPQQLPQGQPVMAASGGSIDQLMSNLGQYYAGGGIVAFNEGDKVEDKKAKQREEDRRALLAPLAAIGDIAQLPIAAGYNLAADTGSGLERLLNRIGSALTKKEVNTQSDDQVGNKFRFSPTPFTDMLSRSTDREGDASSQVKPTPVPGAPLDSETQKLLNLAASQAQTGVNTNPALKPKPPVEAAAPTANTPRPNAGIAGGPAKPAVEATDPMEVALRKSIMDALAQDPEAIRKKAMEDNAKFVGLDALLKPAQDRAAAREAMIKGIQANRTPAWVEALAGARKQTRGGIGSLIGQMGDTAQATREGYQTEDLKFFDELSRLNSEIDKAKIEGRYKDVAAGQAAVKDLISEKRQAEQSGTSLLNTKENARSREQTANIAAQARRDAAAAQAESARAGRQQRQQNWIAEQERKWQDTLSKSPAYKDAVALRSMQERLLYMSTDPKTQEKAQAAIDAINERIAKMMPTAMGGAGNLPPGAKFLGFEPSKK